MADQSSLTLDTLRALSPISADGKDIVTLASRDVILSSIKMNAHVRDIFFPDANDQPNCKLDAKTFPMDTLTVAFLAEAIGNIKDEFSFYRTINISAVNTALKNIYKSLEWKKLGLHIYSIFYPEVVKDPLSGLTLKSFLDDNRGLWAEQLSQSIQTPDWINSVQTDIVRGRCSENSYNRDMNNIFVKLHILSPQTVIPVYQFLLNQKALPTVNLEVATRDYLGGSLDWRIMSDHVRLAEHVESRSDAGVYQLTQCSKHAGQCEILSYGVNVDEFIVTECRNFGFWSGERPNSTKTVAKDAQKCILM